MNALKSIPESLNAAWRQVRRYRVLIFLLAIALVYGFVFERINTLSNVQPTPEAIATQNNPIKKAHIDKNVVKQLESLRDNSVNVQALFKQARNNPFQE